MIFYWVGGNFSTTLHCSVWQPGRGNAEREGEGKRWKEEEKEGGRGRGERRGEGRGRKRLSPRFVITFQSPWNPDYMSCCEFPELL